MVHVIISVVTFVIGFILGYFNQEIYNTGKLFSFDYGYRRTCPNCRHAVPTTSRDGDIKVYCSKHINANISAYPIQDFNTCGHFEFTDAVREVQLRLSSEKMLREKDVFKIKK